MTIQQLLNENIRAGGKVTEEKFVTLTSKNNKPRVVLENTKTKLTYVFDFGGISKKMTQARVLSRLIKEGIDFDVNTLSINIKVDESNLYKHDAKAIEEIKNDDLWSGVDNIKKGDLIEIKKEGYYCKAFYAETFKLSSQATMDRYRDADKIIKDNYDKIVNNILNLIKEYINSNLKESIDLKDKTYFPHKLATLTGNEWAVSGWTKDEFWADMKVQKVGYGTDNEGREIPRIQLHFNESIIEKTFSSLVEEITNGSNALQITPENNIKSSTSKQDNVLAFPKLAQFKIEIPFTIYFQRG